ncbi:MAG TPA: FG-GAP-like repeat-containing protein [Gammaproteobacteria bacterium]
MPRGLMMPGRARVAASSGFVAGVAAIGALIPALLMADPVFTSRPPNDATVGERYVYRMTAVDDGADGDGDGDRDDDGTSRGDDTGDAGGGDGGSGDDSGDDDDRDDNNGADNDGSGTDGDGTGNGTGDDVGGTDGGDAGAGDGRGDDADDGDDAGEGDDADADDDGGNRDTRGRRGRGHDDDRDGDRGPGRDRGRGRHRGSDRDDDEHKAGDDLRFAAIELPSWLRFDGEDTIFGTPRPEDAGEHRVVVRAEAGGGLDEQSFSITVAPSATNELTADLEALLAASPNPVSVDDAAVWTAGVRNHGDADVANVVLEIEISGDAPLLVDEIGDAACSRAPRDDGVVVTCRWAPLPAGEAASVEIAGSASEPGEIAAVSKVSIADSQPVDHAPGNDEARVVLSVAEAPSGGPSQELSAPGAADVAVDDFDGDGRDDLAVATGAGEATLVFLNAADPDGGGAGSFSSVPLSADDASPSTGIAAGDLDGDGNADLALANSEGPNHVLFNNGAAGFEMTTLEASEEGSNAVDIGDFDGDGMLDVAFANDGTNVVHRNLGSRQFAAGEDVGAGPSAAVVAVDVDGDNPAELVFANADGDAEVYGRGDAGFASTAVLETGPAVSVAATDVDADGAADLAFGRSEDADLVFRNASAGAPSFSLAASLGEAATADVLLGDFDADGRSDVVTIGAAGAHRLYANDGTAFTPRSDFVGRAASRGAAGSFDGDGILDVAVAGSDVVAIFLNDGRGRFRGAPAGAPLLTLNGEPRIVLSVGDTYEDPGATATDADDGDLTDRIVVDNPVDTGIIGSYTVTYEVVDSSGNRSTVTRVVEVQARDAEGGGGGALGVPMILLLLTVARLRKRRRAPGSKRSAYRRIPVTGRAAVRHAAAARGALRAARFR